MVGSIYVDNSIYFFRRSLDSFAGGIVRDSLCEYFVCVVVLWTCFSWSNVEYEIMHTTNTNNSFRISPYKLDWQSAEDVCVREGGHLLHIYTPQVCQTFFYSFSFCIWDKLILFFGRKKPLNLYFLVIVFFYQLLFSDI